MSPNRPRGLFAVKAVIVALGVCLAIGLAAEAPTRAASPTTAAKCAERAVSKVRSAGKDWRSNPTTRIKWGLNYIKGRYKAPCRAWSRARNTGWY